MSSQSKKVAVVKVGGDMLLEKSDRYAFAENLNQLISHGWSCVVLHGGGPQINHLQKLQGLTPEKIEGRRITSEADLNVVKQGLCGQVNVDLVAALLAQKVNAFGCHGASALLLQANKRPPMEFENIGLVDLGEVGDVVKVNSALIDELLALELTPVIASLGVDQSGQVFNINADTTAAALAKAINAQLLILCTKVGGVFEDINNPNSRIPEITSNLAKKLIENKIITEGMIPKVNEALSLLDQGVRSIAIVNANQAGSFVALTDKRSKVGTRFIKD